MSRKSFVISSFIYTIAILIERGTLILISFLASVNLDSFSFSKFGQFTIAVSTIAGYSTLGISTMISKFSVELKNGSKEKVNVIKTIYLISMSIVLIILMFKLIFSSGEIYSIEFLFLAISCIALSSFTNTSSILLGFEAHGNALFSSLVFVIIAFTTYYIFRISSDGINYFFIFVISYLAYSLISIYYAHSHIKSFKVPFGFALKDIIAVSRDISPLIITSCLASGLIWYVSYNLINRGNTNEHVAFLIGLQWSAIATFIPSVLLRIIFPRMISSATLYDGKRHHIFKSLFLVSILVSFITLITAILVLLFSEQIDLFYKDKIGISLTIFLYIIFSIPGSLANLFGNQLIALGKPRQWLISSLGGFIVIFILFLIFNEISAFRSGLFMSLGYLTMIFIAVFCLTRNFKKYEFNQK